MKKYINDFTFEPPFVVEVANAELVGPKAVGFDETGDVILETTIPQYYLSKYCLERSVSSRTLAHKQLPELRVTKLDIACSLVYKWEGNYWHWIVDCLTRLEGIEYYYKQTGVKPCLIINSNPTSWQLEFLDLLGYNTNDCLRWNGSRMQVKQLVVPSFRRLVVNKNLHSFVSPQACRWVSQRILSNLPSSEDNNSFSKNIFVSRRKALGRRIINEDKIMEALSPLGFTAYVLEDMSVTEQARLFSQARIAIAPHGAGLANMIFAQNLSVIELFGSFMQPCYFLLAQGLGFKYGFLKGQSPRTEVRWQDGDMLVNIDELLKLLTSSSPAHSQDSGF
ncbi:glycosyltransferase family 61 protein [Pleurocapsales cyanobacterium LEGE 10410]|nr:glycosyltransferase family 61 protein [Pleurocapsales cyanobacterium LEGE 10410]